MVGVREKVNGIHVSIASTPAFDIASQGETVGKAAAELKEAIKPFLEEPGGPIQVGTEEVFTSTTNVGLPSKRSPMVGCTCFASDWPKSECFVGRRRPFQCMKLPVLS